MIENNKLRILHVFGIMDMGGSETLIMNVYRKINLNKIDFNFLVHSSELGHYDDEIRDKGGHIFYLPRYSGINHFSYKNSVEKFFEEHSKDFDVVHCHIRSTANIISKYAKKNGLKVILHAHSISNGTGIVSAIKDLFQKKALKYSDVNIACSEDAGIWQFGKQKFTVIHNGIDITKLKFSEKNRSEIRNRYSSDEKIIFGHVGRFVPEKNHQKIIQLFSEYVKIHPKSELWLIGEGFLKEVVMKQVDDLSIGGNVKFLGLIDNIGPYLSAMDIFLFLSKYEGLGISLIEAQCSGLPSLISEGIPKESVLNNELVVRLTEENLVVEGVTSIQKLLSREENREMAFQYIVDNDYAINQTIENLVSIYNTLKEIEEKEWR
ncbi:glycosyltransferase [Enterococcus hirae]|uniref:glycosyltransferase n=1 Tax=Enterococcus faecium TaxID=1352 RepID=UPI002ECE27AD|nr:glycosyltransferase [Enterococcus hirae]HAP8299430.1 glycosyltransferase family 1 protein [Enterococcus faecium]